MTATPAAGRGTGSGPALLNSLVAEREPSLDQLRRERDDTQHFNDAVIEMAANRVRVLVDERNGRIA